MTSAFLEGAFRAAFALAIASAAGIVVVASAPRRLQRDLAAAFPVAGVVLVVVVAHWLSLALSYRIAAWIITVVAVGSAIAVLAVPRLRPDVPARQVLRAVILVAAALPAVAILLVPLRHAPASGLAFTSPNHDAFFFSAIADRFVHAPATGVPDIGLTNASPEGPSDGPTVSYQPFKRFGEASIQGLPTALLGGTTSRHWFALTAMWLLLLPGAAFLLARGLGADESVATIAGILTGLLVAGGGVVAYTVMNQNGPFMLGLPLLVAAGGVLGLLAGETRVTWSLALIGSLFVAGWLGTYFELAVLAVPLFSAIALLRRTSWSALAGMIVRVGIGVGVVGFVCVLNAVRGVLFLDGARARWNSYFVHDTPFEVAAKLAGQRLIEAFPTPPPRLGTVTAVVLLAWWVFAIGLALTWRSTRWVLPPVAAVAFAYWWSQSRGVTNYTANRVAAMSIPVVGTLAVCGVVAAIMSVKPPRAGWVRPAAAVAMAIAALAAAFSTLQHVRATEAWAVGGRSVTAPDVEAAEWLHEVGGPDGAKVAVVTADYVGGLIMLDLTRDLPDVGWSALWRDYTGQWGFSSTARPEYALAPNGSTVVGSLPVARANDRWTLYRLDGAGAVVSPPFGMNVTPGPDSLLRWTGPRGYMGVAFAPQCKSIDAVVSSAGPTQQQIDVQVGDPVDHVGAAPVEVRDEPAHIEIPSPPDGTIGFQVVARPNTAVVDLLVGFPPACTS